MSPPRPAAQPSAFCRDLRALLGYGPLHRGHGSPRAGRRGAAAAAPLTSRSVLPRYFLQYGRMERCPPISQTFSLKPCEWTLFMLKPCVGTQTPVSPKGRAGPATLPPPVFPSSAYLGGRDAADLLGRQAFQQRGLPRVVQPQQDNAELLLRGAPQLLDDGEQPLRARGAGGALRGAGLLQSTLVLEGEAVGCGYPVSVACVHTRAWLPRCPGSGWPCGRSAQPWSPPGCAVPALGAPPAPGCAGGAKPGVQPWSHSAGLFGTAAGSWCRDTHPGTFGMSPGPAYLLHITHGLGVAPSRSTPAELPRACPRGLPAAA